MQGNQSQVVAQVLAQPAPTEVAVDGVAQAVAQSVVDQDQGRDGAPVAFCGDASLRFACRIVRDHGRRRRDGLVQVDRSVRQIAQDHGLSPGTVQSRLRELDAYGVRCSARPTVIDPGRLDELLSPTTPTPASSPASGSTERNDPAPASAHPDLDGRTSRLLSLAAELTATDPSMLDIATEIAQRALISLAETGRATTARPGRAESREEPRDSARFISNEMNEIDHENQHSSIPSSREGSRQTRARTGVDESRGSRDDDRLLELVAPLVAACDDLGLPGVTNLPGLRSALQPFCDEAVAAAVDRLTTEARSGLRTPMGKLVNMARTRDRAYFSPRAPSSPSATSPAPLEMVTSKRHGATLTVDDDRADDEDVERLPPEEVNKRVAAIRERLSGSASPGANR